MKKVPYKEAFDKDERREVYCGILGSFWVEVVKDDAGRRFLSVVNDDRVVVTEEIRAQVLEVFALSLIEREEDAKEAK